jgi:hypothetical protein
MPKALNLSPLAGDRTHRFDSRPNSWGPVVAEHVIGDIGILEYLRDNSNLSGLDVERIASDHGKSCFGVYVKVPGHGWKSTSTHYDTLDSALVGAIDFKREGANSRAATMFDRMTFADNPEGFYINELKANMDRRAAQRDKERRKLVERLNERAGIRLSEDKHAELISAVLDSSIVQSAKSDEIYGDKEAGRRYTEWKMMDELARQFGLDYWPRPHAAMSQTRDEYPMDRKRIERRLHDLDIPFGPDPLLAQD